MHMKTERLTEAWRLYEVGKEYKRRMGLYETVRRNEKFYRGEQWKAADDGLPRPVFNVVRRVADYLISSIAPDKSRLIELSFSIGTNNAGTVLGLAFSVVYLVIDESRACLGDSSCFFGLMWNVSLRGMSTSGMRSMP